MQCLTGLATLPMAGGNKQMTFEVPSNPSYSMIHDTILMIQINEKPGSDRPH